MKLRDIGEDRLLGPLLSRLSLGKEVVNGPGDDCAVVETRDHRNLLVLKTDCVVAGVHFLPTANALHVGWKAMMRPLSDFAATSAVPQFALITLIAPEKTKVEWVERLYRGLSRAAKRFKVSIVGGEMSGTAGPVAISVSVVGFVERNRCVSRRGGKAGDDLFVTGRLGGALKQKHLQFVPRIVESRWLTRNFPIHAMMDLSDGLGADLPRLAKASRVGFAIEMENLPLARGAKIDNAISEGEDYELLFAISPRERNSPVAELAEKISEDCCSLASAPSLDSQPETHQLLPIVATLISNSPAETEAVGRRLAEDAEVGSILALQGELGSGKTLFTKGFVAGMGSNTAVFSPTFTIVHEYRNGRLPVYHFDFFRVESRQSLARLGLDDYFFGDGVSVIEWADRFPEFIPEQARWIRFEIKSENQRAITFQGT